MSKYQEPKWETVPVSDGGQMRMFVVRTGAPVDKAPAVIIFHEAFGVNAHIQETAKRVAALGYTAVAPELFHRTAHGFIGDYDNLGKSKPHMDAITHTDLENDIRAAYHWLDADKRIDSKRIAVTGYCFGGKVAFIANSILPLCAAISYYGSSIPSVLSDYADSQRAPLLLFWAGQDKHINTSLQHSIAEVLRKKNKTFRNVEFSNAGHGFFCPERKTYDADAAGEAWAMQAVFMHNHLQEKQSSASVSSRLQAAV
ncbi:MAG TPA: dienelactone hydrolase family protein [Rickettsiales bacterium]|nr:dienelactone hydrolase family protein [Rickettsiales bacterium]